MDVEGQKQSILAKIGPKLDQIGQNHLLCPREQNKAPFSMVKKSTFCFKMTFSGCKCLENSFSTSKNHFKWLFKVKSWLFNHWQNFHPGQFWFCCGQTFVDKTFVLAERQGIRLEILKFCSRGSKSDNFWLKFGPEWPR